MSVGSEGFVVKTSADPAAGAEISYTADENLLVKTFHVSLVTSATAADRQVHFTFEDADAKVYARFVAGDVQAASATRQYAGRPGEFSAPNVEDTVFVVPLPNGGIYLPKDGKLKTVTTLIKTGDNFGALSLSAKRF